MKKTKLEAVVGKKTNHKKKTNNQPVIKNRMENGKKYMREIRNRKRLSMGGHSHPNSPPSAGVEWFKFRSAMCDNLHGS